jgi:hypothetical protein
MAPQLISHKELAEFAGSRGVTARYAANRLKSFEKSKGIVSPRGFSQRASLETVFPTKTNKSPGNKAGVDEDDADVDEVLGDDGVPDKDKTAWLRVKIKQGQIKVQMMELELQERKKLLVKRADIAKFLQMFMRSLRAGLVRLPDEVNRTLSGKDLEERAVILEEYAEDLRRRMTSNETYTTLTDE